MQERSQKGHKVLQAQAWSQERLEEALEETIEETIQEIEEVPSRPQEVWP
jgi:hypothetical protein